MELCVTLPEAAPKTKPTPVLERCSLCFCETKDLVHLPLYVQGSKGISACLLCRILLTKVAEGILHAAGRSRLAVVRQAKQARSVN